MLFSCVLALLLTVFSPKQWSGELLGNLDLSLTNMKVVKGFHNLHILSNLLVVSPKHYPSPIDDLAVEISNITYSHFSVSSIQTGVVLTDNAIWRG